MGPTFSKLLVQSSQEVAARKLLGLAAEMSAVAHRVHNLGLASLDRGCGYITLFLVLGLVAAHSRAGQLHLIQPTQGGDSQSNVFGVSGDGNTVVGVDEGGQFPGVLGGLIWTAEDGSNLLPDISAGGNDIHRGAAYAVSSTRVAVGVGTTGIVGETQLQSQATRWTSPTAVTPLGFLPGFDHTSVAYGISDDGERIAGYSGASAGQTQAAVWTNGLVRPLGFLDEPTPRGVPSSIAYGISRDGETVVGFSRKPDFGLGEAFRWTDADGMVGLGFLASDPNRQDSTARDASSFGDFIVGTALTDESRNAFLWSATDGMQELLDPTGRYVFDDALAVSADARVIVGQGYLGDNSPVALVWLNGIGLYSVPELLDALGVVYDPTFRFEFAHDVSAAGTVIVGIGRLSDGSERGWVVDLPALLDLFGDFNDDSIVTAADYAIWRDGASDDDSIAGYNAWAENFGSGPLSSTAPVAVPEPSNCLLLAIGYFATVSRFRGNRRCLPCV